MEKLLSFDTFNEQAKQDPDGLKVGQIHKYQNTSDKKPADIVITQIVRHKDGSVRLEISRDLETKKNPFWIKKTELSS
jgi:hypothetical protein